MPSAIAGDRYCQASLSVQHAERLVHVNQFSLDLDHQERPGRLVPGEDVDPTALAVYCERDLGRHLPAPRSQQFDNQTVVSETPARFATSVWRQPLRRRTARNAEPTRKSSTP
jgi:hypothetical protein